VKPKAPCYNGGMVIPRGSKRITYSSEIRKLKTISFSKEQKSIILGSLLGDGCLTTAWSGSSKNYRFAVTHSVKQKDYINWTYKQLKPFVLTPPKLIKSTQALILRTMSHSDLTELKSVFYPQNKKVLPKNIRLIIQDSLALAVWFMDDGNIVKKNGKLAGYNLNTQSFSKDENILLINIFRELYNINFMLDRNKNKYRLGVWQKQSREDFRSLIERFVISSMRYKLG